MRLINNLLIKASSLYVKDENSELIVHFTRYRLHKKNMKKKKRSTSKPIKFLKNVINPKIGTISFILKIK